MRGKLLIIEDEKRLRTNLQLLLAAEDYSVSTAADGPEALQYLQRERFDIIITDTMMGGMNGFQAMDYIATHPHDTLVIGITGHASTESAIEALRKGAYDYIAKPFEIDMILLSLARAMEKVRLQQALQNHLEALEQRVVERTRALEDTNQQLQRSLAALESTQAQLIQTEKLSALGELISGFAHELNNPLTTVLGYAELLIQSSSCPPKVQFMLEKSHEEAVRCHQIVQNLLGFARKHKPAKQAINLHSICLKTLNLLAYQFKVNNITLVTRFAEDLPMTMADGHQLQQVLVNIFSNACQAMADYQGKRQLTITTATEAAQISLTIADTGPGMSPEHLRRIFDPFYTTKEKGTGLGLSLSYGLIKEHGGEITATSAPDKGATFTIVLPLVAESDGAPAVPPPAASVTTAPKRALVIDDEPNLAQMLVATLQSMGHQAEAVSSGREALEKLTTQAYDLIICDMRLPEVDGRHIYHFVQQHRPDLLNCLVLSSGDTVSEAHKQFFQETRCLFLPKPFLLEELTQVIAQTSAVSAA